MTQSTPIFAQQEEQQPGKEDNNESLKPPRTPPTVTGRQAVNDSVVAAAT